MHVKSLFRITPGLREKHNYRWDTAYRGDYLCRLPDGRLVRAADYPQALEAFEQSGRKS